MSRSYRRSLNREPVSRTSCPGLLTGVFEQIQSLFASDSVLAQRNMSVFSKKGKRRIQATTRGVMFTGGSVPGSLFRSSIRSGLAGSRPCPRPDQQMSSFESFDSPHIYTPESTSPPSKHLNDLQTDPTCLDFSAKKGTQPTPSNSTVDR